MLKNVQKILNIIIQEFEMLFLTRKFIYKNFIFIEI